MNKVQKKTYMVSAIFFSVIISLLYFGNVYLVDYLKLLSSDVLGAKEKIDIIERGNRNIPEVRKNYENIKKEINFISDSISDSEYDKVVNLFMELEDVAKKNDIELKKNPSSNGEESLGDGLSATHLDIEAIGEYDNIMKFILYLDNFKYYVDLNNVNITNRINEETKKEFPSAISLKGDLKVYLKEKAN